MPRRPFRERHVVLNIAPKAPSYFDGTGRGPGQSWLPSGWYRPVDGNGGRSPSTPSSWDQTSRLRRRHPRNSTTTRNAFSRTATTGSVRSRRTSRSTRPIDEPEGRHRRRQTRVRFDPLALKPGKTSRLPASDGTAMTFIVERPFETASDVMTGSIARLLTWKGFAIASSWQ